MDFFEAQDQARRGTGKLVVLFALAMLGTLIALNVVAVGAAHFVEQGQDEGYGGFDWFRPGLMGVVSLATIAVIGGASLFKTAQLHGDGGKVARLLGGRKLDPASADDDERKLLNVVEEMSLASGVPVPDVYVMDRESGINAFAAGSDLDNAAIGVTRGLMETMTRDELQGVIAHEYSHILNGDMRLNVRLIGVVFGILVIGLLGYAIFRYAPYLMHSRGSSNSKNNGAAIGLALFVVGGLVWLVGSIGVFFGRLIQASISRQREYLADASAVQFTRNPNGIRDALRKIGGNAEGATVHNPHAGECSHLFFGNAFSSLFRTHPPLPDRIRAIDPNWNGRMLKAEQVPDRDRAEHEAGQRRSRPRPAFGPLGDILSGRAPGGAGGAGNPIASMLGTVAGAASDPDPRQAVAQRGGTASARGVSARGVSAARVAERVGQLDAEHIEYAGLLAKSIPPQVRQAARRPELARGLVASLFVSDDPSVWTLQAEALVQRDEPAARAVDAMAGVVRRLGAAGRLPVMELCAPALRSLDERTGREFLAAIREMAEADRRVDPSEYALYKLAERLILRPPVRERHATVEDVAGAARTALSGLAAAGSPGDDRAAASAYGRGIAVLEQGHLAYQADFKLADFDAALTRLAEAYPRVKRAFVEAAAATVTADGAVTIEEAELLRATAAVLQCPLPPFLESAVQPRPA